jgi:hypothetical protein
MQVLNVYVHILVCHPQLAVNSDDCLLCITCYCYIHDTIGMNPGGYGMNSNMSGMSGGMQGGYGPGMGGY